MRWNWKYAGITLGLFILEVLIALYVHDSFIRPFIGDLLVVVLLYFGVRTISKAAAKNVAIGVLIFACSIEILQYFRLVEMLGLENNKVACVIIGSTFDWFDLLAYSMGGFVSYWMDRRFIRKKGAIN